jgi:hypothetical protein
VTPTPFRAASLFVSEAVEVGILDFPAILPEPSGDSVETETDSRMMVIFAVRPVLVGIESASRSEEAQLRAGEIEVGTVLELNLLEEVNLSNGLEFAAKHACLSNHGKIRISSQDSGSPDERCNELHLLKKVS